MEVCLEREKNGYFYGNEMGVEPSPASFLQPSGQVQSPTAFHELWIY